MKMNAKVMRSQIRTLPLKRGFSTPARPPPKTPEEIKANIERAKSYERFNTATCNNIHNNTIMIMIDTYSPCLFYFNFILIIYF